MQLSITLISDAGEHRVVKQEDGILTLAEPAAIPLGIAVLQYTLHSSRPETCSGVKTVTRLVRVDGQDDANAYVYVAHDPSFVRET